MSMTARRFIIAAPPSSTAWIGEALARAFGRPEGIPEALERLIERLNPVARRELRN